MVIKKGQVCKKTRSSYLGSVGGRKTDSHDSEKS